MPVKNLTPEAFVRNSLETGVERLKRAVVNTLMYVGERCLNAARGTNSYIDRTGNLRSSLGYVVVSEGKVVGMSSFDTVFSGAEGSSKGRRYAEWLVSRYPRQTALVVVAGMNYAAYVSAKGYDVLDSAELLAEKIGPQLLKQLKLS